MTRTTVRLNNITWQETLYFTCNLKPKQLTNKKKNKQTLWLESASELYRPSGRRLSAKLVPTLADRGCRVVGATNTNGR
jgi:hypothetical protein